MCSDRDTRNESLADQLADALSPNPFKRVKSSSTLADSVSRALANDLAGNDPSVTERAVFGGRHPLRTLQQYIMDGLFSR
jgi:hypothetical protein